MTPDDRAALQRALWLSAFVAWLAWLVWPVSREVALVLLATWVLLAAWMLGGRG
jgi:hypothetical protein